MIAEAAEQLAELLAILRGDAPQQLVHVVRVQRQEVLDERAALLREPHACEAAILRVGSPHDDAVALGASRSKRASVILSSSSRRSVASITA